MKYLTSLLALPTLIALAAFADDTEFVPIVSYSADYESCAAERALDDVTFVDADDPDAAACMDDEKPETLSAFKDTGDKDDEEWVSLFNGENLDGWIPKIRRHEAGDNFGNTFRVKDGVMQVGYEAYDEFGETFGHIFYKEPFSHYRLRLEYRFIGEQCKGGPGWAIRNSGIMVHGESPETMAVDQDFPVSIEVQLLGGNGTDDRATANLCTPGTNVEMDGELVRRHCTNSKSETYHGEQWVTCEVEVRGSDVIRHLINGEEVMSYQKPQLDDRDGHAKELAEKNGGLLLEKGTISLQSESHPCEFRNIEILVLDADDK